MADTLVAIVILQEQGGQQVATGVKVARNIMSPKKSWRSTTFHGNAASYDMGVPYDWNVTLQTPSDKLMRALQADDGQAPQDYPYLDLKFAQSEVLVIYVLMS
ncbi:hypothetical protein N8T08_004559 [Aspergillus melleus]|uniref:Uncharacterized protein n=1 Tax=Aspergillus melleus TaxID=138277 RepID=A0ACC3B3Y4_9EURO|nr:hypothetical protein N8T08_004559 [Aspergillus melleus]